MMTDETRRFFTSLTPKGWTWIGCQAFLRTPAGVFELHEYSGGKHGDVAGLSGMFTATTGAQSHMTFRFEDLLVATNPTKNPNWRDDDKLRGWWSRGSVDWYIGQPKTLTPLHDAISKWVAVWTGVLVGGAA